MNLNLLKAFEELHSKTLSQIQVETAQAWGSRAAAAYQLFAQTSNIHWLLDAEEYYHEALEHAALGGVVGELEEALAPYRVKP